MVIKRRGKDNHIRCEEFFDESSPHCLFVHKALHNHRPRIRDLPRRHLGPSLVPANQGGVLVVPPAHHGSGTHPEPDAWLAANAVTDGQIEALHREAWEHSPLGAWRTTGIPMRYGTGIGWDEFHAPTEYHGAPRLPHHRTHNLAYNPIPS